MPYDSTIAAPRKLTDDEVTKVRAALVEQLPQSPDTLEDVGDLIDYTLAMVSNGKTVAHVIQELLSMEMEILPETSSDEFGHALSEQLMDLFGTEQEREETSKEEQGQDGTNEVDDDQPRVASLKSSSTDRNALTMSGALGSSRQGGKGKNEGTKQKENKQEADHGVRKKDRKQQREERGRNDRPPEDDRRVNNRGERRRDDRKGRSGVRLSSSEAFDRLSGGRGRGGRGDDDRWRRGGGGPGRGRGPRGGAGWDDRSGRGGGSGSHRDDRGRGGPRDGQGGRGSRRDRGGGDEFVQSDVGRGRGERGNSRAAPMTGKRQDRDYEDNISPDGAIRGGRGGGRGRGAPSGPSGRGGRGGPEGNKRQRFDESDQWHDEEYGDNSGYYEESYGGDYNGGYYNYSPSRGGYRGGRGGRGYRGRGRGGRGFATPTDGGEDGQGQTPVSAREQGDGEGGDPLDESGAAAVHPSPIVAASYRGHGYRGRGRGFRGRGRGRGYRAQVASMLASKTWVRPKTDDDGGKSDDKGGGDGGGSAAPES